MGLSHRFPLLSKQFLQVLFCLSLQCCAVLHIFTPGFSYCLLAFFFASLYFSMFSTVLHTKIYSIPSSPHPTTKRFYSMFTSLSNNLLSYLSNAHCHFVPYHTSFLIWYHKLLINHSINKHIYILLLSSTTQFKGVRNSYSIYN